MKLVCVLVVTREVSTLGTTTADRKAVAIESLKQEILKNPAAFINAPAKIEEGDLLGESNVAIEIKEIPNG